MVKLSKRVRLRREAYLTIVATMRGEMNCGNIDQQLEYAGFNEADSAVIERHIGDILDGFVSRFGPKACDNFCVDNQGICHNCGYPEKDHGRK